MFDIYNVILEIYIEDKVIQKQQIQAPKEMLIMNFIQLASEIRNDKRPMKIRMIVPQIIWDNFEKKQRQINNEVEISNNAMDAWMIGK